MAGQARPQLVAKREKSERANAKVHGGSKLAGGARERVPRVRVSPRAGLAGSSVAATADRRPGPAFGPGSEARSPT
jgi:hypothetical protein